MFEGSRHETLHDREQERARNLIKDWILDHLKTFASVSSAQSEAEEPPSALGESPEEPLQTEQQSTSESNKPSQQPASEDQEKTMHNTVLHENKPAISERQLNGDDNIINT